LAQVVSGARDETIDNGDQEVKGQGHIMPKLHLETWKCYHSWSFYFCIYVCFFELLYTVVYSKV